MTAPISHKNCIIIFYINPHSGHHSAALALEKSFKEYYPDVRVEVLDFMKFINPVFAKLMMRLYKSIIRRTPKTWEYLYDNPKVLRKTKKLRESITQGNLNRIRKCIAEFKPKAIICTQAIPCAGMAFYKDKQHLAIPLFGVSTDFSTHAYWIHDQMNGYVVPSDREKYRLLSRGIPLKKIRAFGIPIDPKFSMTKNVRVLEHELDLKPGVFKVLLMGGSQGLGKIKTFVKKVLSVNASFQLLIVAGTNMRLLEDLQRLSMKNKYQGRLKIYGHVENIDELLEVSDVIMTKPGGLTVSEAMAKDCPMVLINPLPGQEGLNTEYLLGENAALKAEGVEEAVELFRQILDRPEQLKEISVQYRRLKAPMAAKKIVSWVMDSFQLLPVPSLLKEGLGEL